MTTAQRASFLARHMSPARAAKLLAAIDEAPCPVYDPSWSAADIDDRTTPYPGLTDDERRRYSHVL